MERTMMRLPVVAIAGLAVSLALFTAPGAQHSSDLQALEAQIREADRAGLAGPELDMLRDMLEDLKREEAEARSFEARRLEREAAEARSPEARRPEREEAETRRPEMRPNHFDTVGRPDYGDCSRYDDPQALAFCTSAGNAYQSYLKAFSLSAARTDLQTLYDAHLTSARNLMLYLDGGPADRAGDERSRGAEGRGYGARADPSDPGPENGRETGTSRRTSPATGTMSSSLFDDSGSGSPGSDEATAAMKVYEPMPDTFTGEKGWFSKRSRAVFYARLEAVNEISSSCRDRGARADRPDTDRIRSGDAPSRWTFSVPDCRQGGWKDEEWACRATVAGHCYWK